MLSGLVKAVTQFYGYAFPVDFTLFTFGLLIIFLFLKIIIKKSEVWLTHEAIFSIFGLLLFYQWMLTSLFYTSSSSHSFYKLISFGTNLAALSPFLISSFSIKRFLRYYCIGVLSITAWFMPILFRYMIKIQVSESILGLYLSLSIVLGILSCILVTSRENIFFNKAIDYSIVVAGLFCIFLLGGRGPLIFVVLCLIVYFMKKFLFFDIKMSKIVTYSLFMFFGIFVTCKLYWESITVLTARSLLRIASLIGVVNELKTTSYGRVEHIKNSFEHIFSSAKNCFLGTGIGSWRFEIYGVDGRGYPHNIFLEIWFELGLIGLVIFLMLLIPFVKNLRLRYKYVSFYVPVYLLLNMLKSSGLEDLRVFFCFAYFFLLSDNMIEPTSIRIVERKGAFESH